MSTNEISNSQNIDNVDINLVKTNAKKTKSKTVEQNSIFEIINEQQKTNDKNQTTELSQKKSATLKNIIKAHDLSQKAFDKQMADDGWAGDIADGISILWGSDNRASKIREDLEKSRKNINELINAAKKGDKEFNKKFKQIYGIDYNQTAIDEYQNNPNEENYKKAFGTIQKNIKSRVDNYNKSQKTGAAVVKTGAKIGAGVAIGVATGGTGLVALGAAAAGTTVASTLIEETDRLEIKKAITDGEIEFREGTDHKQILKDAAWDGVGTLAGGAVAKTASTLVKGTKIVNAVGETTEILTKGQKITKAAVVVSGDVATGAAQEKLQTGQITAEGTLINAAISGMGSAVELGAVKSGYESIKKGLNKTTKKASEKAQNTKNTIIREATNTPSNNISNKSTELYDDAGNLIAGGLFDNISEFSLKNKIFGAKKLKTLEEVVQEGFNNKSVMIEGKGKKIISKKVQLAQNNNITSIKDLDQIPLSQIAQHSKEGQVCSIGNKLYVNDNGKAVELKMSKEKFNELFPPEGFARIEQMGLNNCWLVSRLNSMTESSYGRSQLYQMIEELPNGDIIVHLKNTTPITFPKGEPIKGYNTISLGNGASPGIEMIHQAVLAKTLQNVECKKNNISNLSASELVDEANALVHSDYHASKYLLGSRTMSEIKGEQEIKKALETTDFQRDMNTAIWGIHARSIIDYNPKTQTITYHDPTTSGIDLQCTLDEFTKNNPSLFMKKAPATEAKPTIPKTNNPNEHSQIQTENTTKNIYTNETPTHQQTSTNTHLNNETNNNTNKISTFTPQTTELKNKILVVARTADGNPIGATVTNSNVIVFKNRKQTSIPIPKPDTTIPILETSTNTYLIIHNNKGKITITTSETPDLPTTLIKKESRINSNEQIPSPSPKRVSLNYDNGLTNTNNRPIVNNNSKTISKQKTELAIPNGAKLIDTVNIMGKECRRIKMPNGEYLTEFNGKWKKL